MDDFVSMWMIWKFDNYDNALICTVLSDDAVLTQYYVVSRAYILFVDKYCQLYFVYSLEIAM